MHAGNTELTYWLNLGGFAAAYFGLRWIGKFIGVTSPDAFVISTLFYVGLAAFLGLALAFSSYGHS